MTILCLQSVMVCEGLAQDDVIEHLNDPDASLVSLMSQEREYFLVLLEGLLVHFQGKRIILQLHQRCEGVTVPEVERVHLVLHQHVEVFYPLCFVVEPWEILWGIGILINCMPRQINSLLQSDAGATHHHSWGFCDGLYIQRTCRLDALSQFHTTVDDTRSVITRHSDALFVFGYCVSFCCSAVCVRKRNLAVCFLGADGITHLR